MPLFGLVLADVVLFVFFFSSRRRHTRLVSDWSSDVCSSDLCTPSHAFVYMPRRSLRRHLLCAAFPLRDPVLAYACFHGERLRVFRPALFEIGRASCRERVES